MNQTKLLVLSMFSAWLFVVLIFGEALGLTGTLLTTSLILTSLFALNSSKKLIAKRGIILLISLILLSISFIFRDQVSLHILNFFVFFCLALVYVIHMLAEDKLNITPSLIIKMLEATFSPLGELDKPIILIKNKLSFMHMKRLSSKQKSILVGLLIALPILVVFTILLSSADAIFNDIFKIDFNFLAEFDGEIIAKIIIFLFSTFYIFSFFFFQLIRKPKNEIHENAHKEEIIPTLSRDTIVSTVLILINCLFVIFTFIQFKYLFSEANVGFEGFTYSQYARKGFFELTVISLLSIMLLVIFNSQTKNIINKILIAFMILNNVVIAYSAIYRMNLYIWSYGYTWLRIVSLSFIILQLIILFIVLVYTWTRKFNIKVWIAGLYLFSYLLLNFVNMDAIIIQGNMNRYLEGEDIDIIYFERLTYDSIDSLLEYQEKFKDNPDHEDVYQEITKLINSKKSEQVKRSWYHYNYSFNHAYQVLNN